MPQAPKYLRDKFEDDSVAIALLETNFNFLKGCIAKKLDKYIPTFDEYDAIDYLVQEWDYCYLG